MTKTQVEVITSVERRRRWSWAEKERIVAAAMEPGAVASAVAREAGIHASQLSQCARPASFLPDEKRKSEFGEDPRGGDPPGITLAGSPTDHR